MPKTAPPPSTTPQPTRRLTPTELRRDIYRLLDQVLETGEPLEIERSGRTLLLVPVSGRRRRLADLPRRQAITCSPEELIATSWEDSWSAEG